MNIQPYIILNNKDSRSIQGLLISSLPPISKPPVRTQIEEIDGRSGDIVTPLGYGAYDKTVSIGLTYGYDIDEIIEFFNTSGEVIFSNEPDKYYRYAIYEQIDFEKLIRFKTAEVTLHVQPYKFSTTEAALLFEDPSEITVTNEGNTDARPNLIISGSGKIDVSLNGSQLLQMDLGEDEQTIIIDTEDMNAYATRSAIREVVADINPLQDLHGYAAPWIDSDVINKTPYLTRALSGTASRIGNYEFNKLVGGTFAFYQLFLAPYTSTTNGITYTKIDNYTVNINGTATNTSYKRIEDVSQTVIGRVYFVDIGDTVSGLEIHNDSAGVNTLGNRYAIGKATAAKYFYFKASNGATIDNKTVKSMIIDLTQLFGSTIADYIYNLEQSQAGAGVSFFKALFDKDYYPYNAGELISVKPTAHITRDGNNTVISNTALDPDLELRGIPKLDENNNLYYDGDTYESNGDVTRRYGIVDLGSLSWTYNKTTWSNPIFYAQISDKANGFNMICVPYITSTTGGIGGLEDKHIIGTSNNYIYIRDSVYTDAATFKAAMSGVYLVYEKASSTTESADPFTDPQEVDANGSEEFVDNRAVSIPVGHESYYGNICEISGFTEANISLNETIYNIAFTDGDDPLTVFGGKLNATTGELRVTHGNIESYNGEAINEPWISSRAAYEQGTTPPISSQVVYPLTTPQKVQLTPTQINNELGLNQLSTDTNGEIEVTYQSNGALRTDKDNIVSFTIGLDDMEKGSLLNRLIKGDYDKIRLKKGDNVISFTGNVKQVSIDKYSRWI